VIAIVGGLAWRDGEQPRPAGRACEIALAAAGLGARVELVGRAGDDPTGDAVLLALGRAGVGHVAVLRDPSHPTPILTAAREVDDAAATIGVLDEPEPSAGQPDPETAPAPAPPLEAADVALGLQYLTAFAVLVVTDDVPFAALPVAIDGAGFAGAHLVILAIPDTDLGDLPAGATVFAVPSDDDDDAFAMVVGAYAAGLDGGTDPRVAFERAVDGAGWEPLAPSV
jgi:hypothetical protein